MKNLTIMASMLLIALVGLVGCASQPKMTQAQVMDQYAHVNRLDGELQEVRSSGAELLAPEGYSKAQAQLERAVEQARNNNGEAAQQTALDGLEVVDQIKQDVASSRDILGEVLQKREDALEAGAPKLRKDEMARLDENLKQTAMLIEQGDTERAKQRRPKLLSGYSQAELAALKEGTVDVAKAAISEARKQDADDYAPQTLAQAEKEMKLAMEILDADRRDTERADRHAKNARWLAEKASAITEIIKDFERRDYSDEEIVLWYQRQLKTVSDPLNQELPLNQENDKVVSSLESAVSAVIGERNMARNQLAQAEQERNSMAQAHAQEVQELKAEYEAQLAMTAHERNALSQMERAEEEKFEKVQNLFDEGEATVYRRKNNVIISAHGFDFPTGQSEIQTDNFPLMNKIIQAIKTFPNAKVEVSGHTDSSGGEAINQALSQSRAEKVSKFLTEVGEVSQSKIKARGFGENKPVASNETQAGRAENRRVEIAIINEE